MLERIFKELRISLSLLFFLTIITGILYPALITVCAQNFFPWRSNGSLITVNNKTVGSALIGQSFTDPKYFWSRPSATTPFPYNAENSSGSNYGPLNQDFLGLIKTRKKTLSDADPDNHQPVPIDLVTASGSGLDPEISPQAAFYQTNRIAKARQLSEEKVESLVRKYIQKPDLTILGEARINVLMLNLALDKLTTENMSPPATIPLPAKDEKPKKIELHKPKHTRHPNG